MAEREEFRDIISAIITGGLSGYQSGKNVELDLRKEVWKETLKNKLRLQQQKELLSSVGDKTRWKRTITPEGGISFTEKSTEDILKEQEAEELLGGETDSTIASKRLAQKVRETQAIEAAKPYGETEAQVISKADIISPLIDKLITKVKTKEIYEGVKIPFGASRVGAFLKEGPWQSFKRGLTGGEGRQAGLLLSRIKILAFSEGGKALTEGEKATVYANLDPSYKTEQQWIDSLETAKDMLESKAKLIKKGPRNESLLLKKNYVRYGTNSKGQRVGQLPDGTIEVISGR